MAACLIILPAGPLLAWKRGDLLGALQRLWVAGAVAVAAMVGAFVFTHPHSFAAVFGLTLGAWLIGGALSELVVRSRLGSAGGGEAMRRLAGLPRGAWGMTLAHIGLGVFVMGACIESSGKIEVAQSLALGQSLKVGAYTLTLKDVSNLDGPNYSAERGTILIAGPGSPTPVTPERRFYPVSRQSTSHIAIQRHGFSDLYVVLGENRSTAAGSAWLVRAYWNPWARMIFLGPLMMALGGAVSLSDRRLRIAAARRPVRAPTLEPAE